MDWKGWLSATALVVLVIAVLIGWMMKERKTINAKKDAAAKNGWTYKYLAPAMFFKYRKLPFVQYEARSRRVKHVLTGEHRGRPITLFTYGFTVSRNEFNLGKAIRGKDAERRVTKRRERGLAVVGLPSSVPDLEIAPRGLLSDWAREKGISLSKFLGSDGARLLGGVIETGDQAFDKEFVIRGRHEGFARAVLNDQVRAWLLRSDNGGKYTVVFKDDEAITWGTGTDVRIGKVKANHVNDLLDQIDADVLSGSH